MARAGISVLQGLCARYQRATGTASASQSGLVGEQSVWERQGQIQLLEKASLSGDAVSLPVRRVMQLALAAHMLHMSATSRPLAACQVAPYTQRNLIVGMCPTPRRSDLLACHRDLVESLQRQHQHWQNWTCRPHLLAAGKMRLRSCSSCQRCGSWTSAARALRCRRNLPPCKIC